MPTVELPQGTVRYRVSGLEGADRPVVFVHGLLSNGQLWDCVAKNLGAQGVRGYAPDWPMGSHTVAMNAGTDLTPRGVAHIVLSFLEALDLHDVTLVGNDSGGAICQFVLDTDHSRIGRLVLTNADAFEVFEPPPFDIVRILRYPLLLQTLLTVGRLRWLRHSPLAYGLLAAKPLDPVLTRSWVEPARQDAGVRRDTTRFVGAIDKQELLAVSNRMNRFSKPVLLVWGAADRFFTIDLARRLEGVFPQAELVEVAGGRTYLPLDEPGRVSDEIVKRFYGSTATDRQSAGEESTITAD